MEKKEEEKEKKSPYMSLLTSEILTRGPNLINQIETCESNLNVFADSNGQTTV